MKRTKLASRCEINVRAAKTLLPFLLLASIGGCVEAPDEANVVEQATLIDVGASGCGLAPLVRRYQGGGWWSNGFEGWGAPGTYAHKLDCRVTHVFDLPAGRFVAIAFVNAQADVDIRDSTADLKFTLEVNGEQRSIDQRTLTWSEILNMSLGRISIASDGNPFTVTARLQATLTPIGGDYLDDAVTPYELFMTWKEF